MRGNRAYNIESLRVNAVIKSFTIRMDQLAWVHQAQVRPQSSVVVSGYAATANGVLYGRGTTWSVMSL
jgi:hypothetical protein